MYAKVWSGAIELQLGDNKSVLLQNGRTAFLRNSFSQPQIVPDIPPLLRSLLEENARQPLRTIAS